jgi:uncharacterized protein
MKYSIVTSFFVAVLFGFGLCFGGMINPLNVIGFLDLFGKWNPMLVFVMGFGILAALPFFLIAKRKGAPIWGNKFPNIPTKIDAKLIIGAAIFGIGWGMIGICPGPALVILAIIPQKAIIFIVAMTLGAKIIDLIASKTT